MHNINQLVHCNVGNQHTESIIYVTIIDHGHQSAHNSVNGKDKLRIA